MCEYLHHVGAMITAIPNAVKDYRRQVDEVLTISSRPSDLVFT